MVCPFCLHKKTLVYNSRNTSRLGTVWRRRRCLDCRREFTTTETIDIQRIVKVKSNTGKIVMFSRPTLFLSILRICDHQENHAEATFMVCEAIEQKILKYTAKYRQHITKEQIIALCLETLRDFDATAYVKYLSYYGHAKNLRSLKKQLK